MTIVHASEHVNIRKIDWQLYSDQNLAISIFMIIIEINSFAIALSRHVFLWEMADQYPNLLHRVLGESFVTHVYIISLNLIRQMDQSHPADDGQAL